MSKRKKRLQRKLRRRERKSADALLSYRSFSIRAASLDDDDRSVEAVITTETPVPMMDWERWEMVDEVLLMDGMQSTRGLQVPLLDAHSRASIENQLGSVRGIVKEDGQLSGRLYFSSTADGAWTKVREGHLTDVSAGYAVEKTRFVPAETTEQVGGRDFTGPVNVVTQWRLREVSITPIGADDQAKLRGLDPTISPKKRSFQMNAELRARCVACGMDPTLDDDAALKWLNENFIKLADADRGAPDPPADPPADPPVEGDIALRVADELEKRQRQKELEDQEYVKEVDAILALAFRAAVPPELRRELIDMRDLEAARARVFEYRDKQPDVSPSFSVNFASDQPQDRHRADIGSALVYRALETSGAPQPSIERTLPAAQRGRGWEAFRHCRLSDFAVECLRADGYNPRGLTREQVAIAALGWPMKAGLQARAGDIAYHTTGSFAKITQDALNKSMRTAYEDAPQTWRGPMRQAESVPDFKTIHRIQLGAVPTLPLWPDNTSPAESSFADEDQTYAVEAYSTKVSFSWRLVVNDDMSALSRVPAMLGDAAARTVNAKAWAEITSNPTMPDGQALFIAATGNRKQTNLTTGAGAPSVSTVGTLTTLMRLVRGLNTPESAESDDILNLSPSFLIGPAALELTILQLVRSSADPAANLSAAVYNPATTLQPVIEPILDATSSTAWYLWASPSRIDTAEVTFLQGQETPVTNDWADEETLSRNYTVIQTFAAKAIDWRGMQRHDGA